MEVQQLKKMVKLFLSIAGSRDMATLIVKLGEG
jgi:hypothetical protein